jgi:hypothetical protein
LRDRRRQSKPWPNVQSWKNCDYQRLFRKNMPLDGRDAFLVSDEFAAGCDAHHFFGPDNRKKYDRLCFINGLDVSELGEPHFVAPVNDFRFAEIFDANHKLVALMADREKVRILGAAAQGHPSGIFKLNRKANNATSMYFNTLPLSAIVPG